MRLLALLAALFLIGCTVEKDVLIAPNYIDSEFKPYLACFEKNINQEFGQVSGMIFSSRTALGRCIEHDGGLRQILINPIEWLNLDFYEKEYLIFHELGHCLLDLEHDDETFNYMNSTRPDGETIKEFREELYLDFFGEGFELCDETSFSNS